MDPSATSLDARSRSRTVRVALVATIGGLLAFLLAQAILAAYNHHVMIDAVDRGWLDITRRDPFRAAIVSLGYGGFSYVMLALAGSAIAGLGHRLAFVLPAVAWILVPAIAGSHRPEPIGIEWAIQCYARCSAGPWFGHPWFGPLADLALVLVPGWAVGRSVPPRRWPGKIDASAVAAILAAGGTVGIVGWAIAAIHSYVDLREIVPIGALGLMLGVTRPWWPWLHLLFAAFVAGLIGLFVDFLIWPDPNYGFMDAVPYVFERTWPILAAGLIASSWQPLAGALRRLNERPLRLVVAVNVLNLVDAVMTALAVGSGHAYESNPVIEAIGLPAKLIVVGALSWILYRRKPSALIWPTVALLWVAAYHVAGVFVNGWR